METAVELAHATKQALNGARNLPLHHFGQACDVRVDVGRRQFHWNPFRYAADLVHMASLVVCFFALLRGGGGTEGVSLKTHLLFFAVFSTRYLNVFFCKQYVYLILYKLFFWLSTLLVVLVFLFRGALSDPRDTCPIPLLLFPTVVITLLFAHYHSVLEVLWIFSQHLEGFAMLPQYVYCYRDTKSERGDVLVYVLCLGGYRMLYGLNWMYKYFASPSYVDVSSWVSGVVNVLFFADFLAFKLCRGSPLSRLCLTVDDGLRDARAFAVSQVTFQGLSSGKMPNVLRASAVTAPGADVVGRRPTASAAAAAGEDRREVELGTGGSAPPGRWSRRERAAGQVELGRGTGF